MMEYKGVSLEEAASEMIHQRLNPNDGGLIAIAADGTITMQFNTQRMFRGAANSTGRFEVTLTK